MKQRRRRSDSAMDRFLPGIRRTKFQCAVCGRVTAGRMPRETGRCIGDGSARYPRRHRVGGVDCPGNILEAVWVTVDGFDRVVD